MESRKLRSMVVAVALAAAALGGTTQSASAMPRQQKENCANIGGNWESWYETMLKQTVWGCAVEHGNDITWDVWNKNGKYLGSCESESRSPHSGTHASPGGGGNQQTDSSSSTYGSSNGTNGT